MATPPSSLPIIQFLSHNYGYTVKQTREVMDSYVEAEDGAYIRLASTRHTHLLLCIAFTPRLELSYSVQQAR